MLSYGGFKWNKIEQECLVDPILNLATDLSVIELTEKPKFKMNIVQATTGVGKTTSMCYTVIPSMLELFNDYKERYNINEPIIILVTAPRNDVSNSIFFQLARIRTKLTNSLSRTVHLVNRIPDKFSNDDIYLIVCTLAKLNSDHIYNDDVFINYMNKSILTAYFADEGHYALGCSDASRYVENVGYIAENHKAQYLKNMANVNSKFTIVYTATPTVEQWGELGDSPIVDFEVLQPIIPKEAVYYRQAQIRKIEKIPSYDRKGSLKNMIRDVILDNRKLKEVSDKYGTPSMKKTALIQVENRGRRQMYSMSKVVDLIKTICIELNEEESLGIPLDDEMFAIMAGDAKDRDSLDRLCTYRKYFSNDNIIDSMNDSENPVLFLLVNQLGTMGIDIPNLGYMLSFKTRKSALACRRGDDKFKFATNNIRQTFGRTCRSYYGWGENHLINHFEMVFEKYHLGEISLGDFMELMDAAKLCNSCDIYMLDNKIYNQAIKEYEDYMVMHHDESINFFEKELATFLGERWNGVKMCLNP